MRPGRASRHAARLPARPPPCHTPPPIRLLRNARPPTPPDASPVDQALNEPYKLEILDAIKTEPITIYHIGDGELGWWDLCAGPHVASTGALDADAIELETVAGAYWRGDETKPMLQRIYGTVRTSCHCCT